jgi:excisionase family DNA binding protein
LFAAVARCRLENDLAGALIAPAPLRFEFLFGSQLYHSRHEAKARRPTAGGPEVAFKPRVRPVSGDEFLTQNQLAERLGVCRQTVVRWVDAGMPCSVRRGAVVRINLDEARPWLANGPARKPAKPVKRRVGRPRNIDRLREKRTVTTGEADAADV